MKQFIATLAVMAFFFAACQREEAKAPPQNMQAIKQKDEQKSGAMVLTDAKQKLVDAKTALAAEGKYDCCMEDACDYCALHEGSCSCAPDLKKGNHVCLECYAGWQQGKGDVPNIKKENVTTDVIHHEHGH
ncbi:MAG: hypothetical protein HY033_07625 [Ignavibacteriae bacterium]|nr:hypothetical protein [Ignavibacteriota bacterium]